MELGIFAKTFPGRTPLPVLTAVRAAGFTVAQYNMACSGLPPLPDRIGKGTVDAISAAVDATGVRLAALSGTFNMIHPDPEMRADGLRRLDLLAATAAAIGVPMITLCTGTRDPDDQWRTHPDNTSTAAWADLLACMERAVIIAEAHDVTLGIEPERANVVHSAPAARRLIDEMGSERLRIVLDPANLFETEPLAAQRRIVAEAIEMLADRIDIAHAKDRLPDGRFTAAGHGVLDYPHFIASLTRAGLDSPLIAHGLSPDQAPGVARFLHRLVAA